MRLSGLFLSVCATLLLPISFLHAQALRRFNSPEAAIEALRDATGTQSSAKLASVLGPDIVRSLLAGDPIADKRMMSELNARMAKGVSMARDELNRVYLTFGSETVPFAVPLIYTNGIWVFDDSAGKGAARARLMAANEKEAVKTLLLFVEAQNTYIKEDRNNDGVLEYAQKFVSSPGSYDGLYRKGAANPINEVIESAEKDGYRSGQQGDPMYRGYHFRILKSQGGEAPGGARDYSSGGSRMTGGFALLAYPSRWNASGAKTFVVSSDGLVYQKDFGTVTPRMAPAINFFNPDHTWAIARIE